VPDDLRQHRRDSEFLVQQAFAEGLVPQGRGTRFDHHLAVRTVLLRAPGGHSGIIVLDQFPRNIFRGDARCFATDADALELAKIAIAEGMDLRLTPNQRIFLYMPFQHSEDKEDQARAIGLYTKLGKPLNLDFALRHQTVVDRFGRFPHRNALLGRASTEEEQAFLAEPGSSF
jgi:uncharacterized protein (DUF924 family)